MKERVIANAQRRRAAGVSREYDDIKRLNEHKVPKRFTKRLMDYEMYVLKKEGKEDE